MNNAKSSRTSLFATGCAQINMDSTYYNFIEVILSYQIQSQAGFAAPAARLSLSLIAWQLSQTPLNFQSEHLHTSNACVLSNLSLLILYYRDF